MELSRAKSREILLQFLFSWEFVKNEETIEELVPIFMGLLEITKKQAHGIKGKLEQLIQKIDFLDEMIKKLSTHYDFNRISEVDKNILRIGIYDFFFENIDVKIIIDEGVRLAKKFSNPEAASFIHAILDLVGKEKLLPIYT